MEKVKNIFFGHKKIFIAAMSLVLLGGIYSAVKGQKGSGTKIANTEVTIIEKKDFVNSVSESGNVKSESEAKIYSEKPLQIKSVDVKVGDKVVEGQVIARLDDSSVDQQIAQKKALISQSKKTAGAQVNSAAGRLNEAIKNRQNGTNPQIVAAESAVISAYDAWKTAEKNYEDFKRGITIGYNEQIQAQREKRNTLENQLNQSNLNYNQTREKIVELRNQVSEYSRLAAISEAEVNRLQNEDIGYSNTLSQLENELRKAQTTPENAHTTPENAHTTPENAHTTPKNADSKSEEEISEQIRDITEKSQKNKLKLAEEQSNLATYRAKVDTANTSITPTERELEQMQLALETANKSIGEATEQQILSDKSREDQAESLRKTAQDLRNSYDSALKSLETAQITADNEIKTLKDNLNIAGASSDTKVNAVDLKYLLEEKDKTEIKSPITGTVTEVNMVKGQTPTDYVAKVETVERTIITSQVKEFDLNNIQTGMEVEISNEKGDQTFKGRVESINPVPKKSQLGESAANTNQEVAYETKITLVDPDNKELQPGMTVRVKYILDKKEEVYTIPSTAIYTKNEKNFILCLEGKSGVIEEKEIKVTTRNDYESVVESENLKDGLVVINSPDMYSNGMEVEIVEAVEDAENN